MADDVWSALVKGVLAFGQTRAAGFVADSFDNTGQFVGALAEDQSLTPNVKAKFNQLKQDIENLVAAVKPTVDAVKPKISDAKTAVQSMAAELGTSPFTMEAAARAATELAFFLKAVDEALLIVADKISRDANGVVDETIKSAIAGMGEPWKKPFRNVGADVTRTFNLVAKQLLDIDNAGQGLAELVSFDRAGKELKLRLARAGVKSFGPMSLENTELIAFLNYKTTAAVGLRIRTKIRAGLRSDKLMEKVIPIGANDPAAETTSIQLDSDKGLSFGDAKSKRLTLPVSFSFPGLELREFMIGLPVDDDPERANKVEIMGTIAGKIGDVMGIVIEGAGVEIKWAGGAGNQLTFGPRLPTGAGMRISAGPVAGGGFIRREGNEYSGILDLKLWEFRITAIGMLVTEPFSFVVILSVRFGPAIELGFGFTLNGLGGILAVNRAVSTDELRKGIRDGTAATLLFPENPIDAAKTILDKVRAVFPPQEGAFAIGPIAEIGWGSQAGFVVAKIGLIICIPDPKLILLGALQVGVPSTKVDEKLRIVDLRAEVYGEFAPEYLLFLVGLNNSKIAKITISGDIGLYIRWAGDADFALSVGGFFPGYVAPAELAGLRRITVDLSPASFLSLRAEGYFAITTNSVQFGAGIHFKAEVGPAEGKAWLTLDALFKWSPRFYFEVRITAGVSIAVFGVDFFGVDFKGTLKGTNPWSIEGSASVSVLFWDFDFDLGPFTWGESDVSDPPRISPAAEVQKALLEPAAWIPKMPAGSDDLVHFVKDETTPLLVHPLGMLELKQLRVPLETKIDRLGSSKLTASWVNLAAPTIQGVTANAVSHATDRFSMGQFVTMSDQDQISRPGFEDRPAGMKVAAANSAEFGTTTGVTCEWETCFPKEENVGRTLASVVMTGREKIVAIRAGASSTKARTSGNPYAAKPRPVGVKDPALREIRTRTDGAVVTTVSGRYSVTEAAQRAAELAVAGGVELVAAGVAS